jgi:hypothetical protein
MLHHWETTVHASGELWGDVGPKQLKQRAKRKKVKRANYALERRLWLVLRGLSRELKKRAERKMENGRESAVDES